MSDRELLEMAAKAAGYTLEDDSDVNGEWWPWCVELKDHWHPLTDDGDALRLAVRLGLSVYAPEDAKDHASAHGNMSWHNENKGSDPYAATRRAIVRAAAEIGRGMK